MLCFDPPEKAQKISYNSVHLAELFIATASLPADSGYCLAAARTEAAAAGSRAAAPSQEAPVPSSPQPAPGGSNAAEQSSPAAPHEQVQQQLPPATPADSVGTVGSRQLRDSGLMQRSPLSPETPRVALSQRIGQVVTTAVRAISATPARLLSSLGRQPAGAGHRNPPQGRRSVARALHLTSPARQSAPSFAQWSLGVVSNMASRMTGMAQATTPSRPPPEPPPETAPAPRQAPPTGAISSRRWDFSRGFLDNIVLSLSPGSVPPPLPLPAQPPPPQLPQPPLQPAQPPPELAQPLPVPVQPPPMPVQPPPAPAPVRPRIRSLKKLARRWPLSEYRDVRHAWLKNQATGRHFIGAMDSVCPHCNALHWLGERTQASTATNPEYQMCCARGKVAPHPLQPPPPYLIELLTRATPQAKNFRKETRKWNCVFQLASTGRAACLCCMCLFLPPI